MIKSMPPFYALAQRSIHGYNDDQCYDSIEHLGENLYPFHVYGVVNKESESEWKWKLELALIRYALDYAYDVPEEPESDGIIVGFYTLEEAMHFVREVTFDKFLITNQRTLLPEF